MFCDKINQQVPLLSEKSNPTVAFNLQKYFEFTYNKYKKNGGMLSEEEFEELMKDLDQRLLMHLYDPNAYGRDNNHTL